MATQDGCPYFHSNDSRCRVDAEHSTVPSNRTVTTYCDKTYIWCSKYQQLVAEASISDQAKLEYPADNSKPIVTPFAIKWPSAYQLKEVTEHYADYDGIYDIGMNILATPRQHLSNLSFFMIVSSVNVLGGIAFTWGVYHGLLGCTV